MPLQLFDRVWFKNLKEEHSGNTIGPESMVVSEIFQGQFTTVDLLAGDANGRVCVRITL
jgi:hypothetical protein